MRSTLEFEISQEEGSEEESINGSEGERTRDTVEWKTLKTFKALGSSITTNLEVRKI